MVSRMINYASSEELLQPDELYTDDVRVATRLRVSNDPLVNRCLNHLDNGFRYEEGHHGCCGLKINFEPIDPMFLEKGRLRRVSDIIKDYEDKTAEATVRGRIGYRVHIFPAQAF